MFRHRILNIITIVSIIIVFLLPFYSKYILFPAYNSFLIFHAEEILKKIGHNMVAHNQITRPINLDTPLPKDFLNDVEHTMKTNGLWKVKIFTPDGIIVYSTDPEDVGNLTRKEFFPEMFKDNKMRSHIDFKEFNEEKGFYNKQNYFIETYIPIKHQDIPIGAFEIYYDITKIKESLEELKHNEQKIMGPIILLLLAGGIFSSYLAHRNMSELKRSKQKFKELSTLDELTGLLNRRGFLIQLEQQLKIINRGNKSVFLIFADLNDFKQINDKFGHEVGDEALKEMAKILNKTFRNADIVGRFDNNAIGRIGGDEFAILATQINDTADSATIHARIEANVTKWNEESSALYKLSLSCGLALYSPDSPCSAAELIHKADSLMYQQKQKNKRGRYENSTTS